MNEIWSVVVIVAAIVALVVVVVGFHELGHFSFGKLFGIRVDEFAIGFGKRVFSRQNGETTYSIRLIPLGGYVKMAGMLNHPSEADAGERNFYRASVPKRLVTLLAGVAFNLVLAGVIYSLTFMLGNPSVVSAGGPLAAAGVNSGDSVVSIAGQTLDHDPNAISAAVHNAVDRTQGQPVTVVVRGSDGKQRAVAVTPRLGVQNLQVKADPCGGTALPDGDSWISQIDGRAVGGGDPLILLKQAHTVSGTVQGAPCDGLHFANRTLPANIGAWNGPGDVRVSWRIGVVPDADGLPPLQAVTAGWSTIPRFFSTEYQGFKELFFNPNSGGPLGANGFEGPIGIGAESVAAAQSGFKTYLGFVGLISLNLALINLLPIPFLDGGKALLVAIEGVRRRRLNPQRELAIYAAGAALLVVFAFYVTIGDIKRMFHG